MKDFKLDDANIGSGFTTPEGFFDAFPQKVIPRLVPERPKNVFERTRIAVYAVAAVLIIALSIPLLSPEAAVDNLDDTTIENYLAHQGNFGQYELLAIIDDADLSAINAEFTIDEQTVEEALMGQNVEQYIIEQ